MVITIEGPDFSGKTTISNALFKELKLKGLIAVQKRECLMGWPFDKMVRWLQSSSRFPSSIKSLIFRLVYICDILFWKPSKKYDIIIQESTPYRVLSYDIASNRKYWAKVLQYFLKNQDLYDYCFYLECPFHVRRDRWLLVQNNDPRDQYRFNQGKEFHLKVVYTMKSLTEEACFTKIDSNQLNSFESVIFIIKEISNLNGFDNKL